MAKTKHRPSSAPPPGVPLELTTAPVDYEGWDSPYRNLDERRPLVRIWEWLNLRTPPKD